MPSAEDRLLLLLARGTLTSEARERGRSLLERPLQWSRLLDRARAHGVCPLLFRNLGRLGSDAVPAAILSEMAGDARAAAAFNALLAHELGRVLRALGSAGVSVIPLKGVALAESLYGDPNLRVSSDLDILVPRDAVRRAVDVLREVGYSAEFTEPFFARLLLRHHIECTLVRRSGSREFDLDVHWGIGWPGRRDRMAAADLWASARRMDFRGLEASAPSPEWQLLFLAVHAARHRWGALKWLVDIHEACVAGGIDWDAVTDKARRFGWEEALRITLRVCQGLLDTPVPQAFSLGGLPPWVQLLPAAPMTQAPWQDALLPLRLSPRLPERMRHLARIVLAPTLAERRLVRLPPCLRALYYPLRPLHLAAKWAWRGASGGIQRVSIRKLCV